MASDDKDKVRATYYIHPELKQKVEDLSIEFGVPQSQIVALLLYYSIEDLEHGKIDLSGLLTRSTSPKFRYNIDLEKVRARFREK